MRRRDEYTLCLSRPAKIRGTFETKWLASSPAGSLEDALEEARAYVTDPRDTVERVLFWSERRQQFAAQVVRRSA